MKKIQASQFKAATPYALAVLLVLAAFSVRWLLQPGFGYAHPYSAFIPVVLISAYFLGPRPAILAAVLSVTLGFLAFVAPSKWFGLNIRTIASFCMFAISTTVGIYFITGMGRALRALAGERARAESLAESHAELFRELNERVTNHLQLVAAVLQLQARNEQNSAIAGALAEASGRTLTISKVHRSLTSAQNEALDFGTFATQLIRSTLNARGPSTTDVDLDAAGVRLTPDQATSVALVLLECLNNRLEGLDYGKLRIHMRGDDKEVRLAIYETRADDTDRAKAANPHLIAAMVEQLSGRFTEREGADGAIWELVFPREPAPTPLTGRGTEFLKSASDALH